LPEMVASGEVKASELPPEYCLIHDHPGQRRKMQGPAVVTHWQASRKYRDHEAHRLASARSTEELLEKIHQASAGQPVAVVGNGKVREGMGERIDAAPVVIRFNAYRTEGREDRIGRKTSAWCVNCWPDWKFYGWRGVPVFTPWRSDETTTTQGGEEVPLDYGVQEWAAHNGLGIGWPSGLGELLVSRHSPGYRRVAQRIGSVRRPSVGFVLLAALHESGIPFEAFGFSGNVNGHDGPAELKAIEAMMREQKARGVAA